MNGARGVLINVTGSSNMTLSEINDAVSVIQNEAHDDANIIFGAVIDEEMGDAVNITVIATGFGRDMCSVQQPEQVQASPRTQAVHVDEPKVERSTARTIVPPEPKDSHMPAFIRRTQREKNSRHLMVVDEFGTETEEDLDIPTFLRKS
jgi:cell division protein FtsZ